MDPRHLYVDKRLVGVCVYCGGTPDSSDHVPSRVLLDDPLPGNLPVVDACTACNNSFSSDEEYVACLLECVLAGTVDPVALPREKIRSALMHSPDLANRIRSSQRVDGAGAVTWMPVSRGALIPATAGRVDTSQ
jgi:hypothetical protein